MPTVTRTLDFEDFAPGTRISDHYPNLLITADQRNSPIDQAMIFDTANPTGDDADLGYADKGNALIISQDDDASDPDASKAGGLLTFDFAEPVDLVSLALLDAERSAKFVAYDEDGRRIGQVSTDPGSNNGEQLVDLSDLEGVSQLVVRVRDSAAIDDLTFVGPNDAPEIHTTSLSSPENQNFVGFVLASDPDGDDLTWSIGGEDAAFFANDSELADYGFLKFLAPPDFENPQDGGAVPGDNIYEIDVSVSDGVQTTTQALEIAVTGLPEFNAVITPAARDFTVSSDVDPGTMIVNFNFDDPDTPQDDADDFQFPAIHEDDFPFQLTPDGRLLVTDPDLLTEDEYSFTIIGPGEREASVGFIVILEDQFMFAGLQGLAISPFTPIDITIEVTDPVPPGGPRGLAVDDWPIVDADYLS